MAVDFPTPTFVGQIALVGNIYYSWDGVAWNIVGNIMNRMVFIDYVFTTGGTWVKPTGLTKLELILVGAGGGSAGHPGSGGATSCAGGGGGAGAVIFACYTDVSILSSHAYVIGTGGSVGNGIHPGGGGGAGSATTFKLLSAGAGNGGASQQAAGSFLSAGAGNGGVATSTEPSSVITRLFDGSRGEQGEIAAHGVASVAKGGVGGANLFSLPNATAYLLGSGSAVATAGKFPGGGGNGPACSVSQGAQTGAVGANGVIYMREWY